MKPTSDNLIGEQKNICFHMRKKHEKVFAREIFYMDTFRNHDSQIKLSEYVSNKRYRHSTLYPKGVESEVDKQKNKQVIEKSNSSFAALITITYKKQDSQKSRI